MHLFGKQHQCAGWHANPVEIPAEGFEERQAFHQE